MFPNQGAHGESVRAKAARLLITEQALLELSLDDARLIVGYMRPHMVKAGTAVIREGDSHNSDFMALVLDGEVTVENSAAAVHDSMVVSVLGPGSLIGQMGIIDGGPRSATCIASTELALALLTRDALMRMLNEHPAVAARLLLAMSKRLADHLRETNRKLMTFSQISKALQLELDAAHSVNRRLLDKMSVAMSKTQHHVP